MSVPEAAPEHAPDGTAPLAYRWLAVQRDGSIVDEASGVSFASLDRASVCGIVLRPLQDAPEVPPVMLWTAQPGEWLSLARRVYLAAGAPSEGSEGAPRATYVLGLHRPYAGSVLPMYVFVPAQGGPIVVSSNLNAV